MNTSIFNNTNSGYLFETEEKNIFEMESNSLIILKHVEGDG